MLCSRSFTFWLVFFFFSKASTSFSIIPKDYSILVTDLFSFSRRTSMLSNLFNLFKIRSTLDAKLSAIVSTFKMLSSSHSLVHYDSFLMFSFLRGKKHSTTTILAYLFIWVALLKAVNDISRWRSTKIASYSFGIPRGLRNGKVGWN